MPCSRGVCASTAGSAAAREARSTMTATITARTSPAYRSIVFHWNCWMAEELTSTHVVLRWSDGGLRPSQARALAERLDALCVAAQALLEAELPRDRRLEIDVDRPPHIVERELLEQLCGVLCGPAAARATPLFDGL